MTGQDGFSLFFLGQRFSGSTDMIDFALPEIFETVNYLCKNIAKVTNYF